MDGRTEGKKEREGRKEEKTEGGRERGKKEERD